MGEPTCVIAYECETISLEHVAGRFVPWQRWSTGPGYDGALGVAFGLVTMWSLSSQWWSTSLPSFQPSYRGPVRYFSMRVGLPRL